nr:retrotransposon-related protein [Tanacetum cinerariifolium]
MKLDVPKFSGANLDRWIFSITEYFTLLSTLVDQRLLMVGLNLEGDVVEWFWWMTHNNLITTWDGFLESVKTVLGRAIQLELLVSKPTSLGDAFPLARERTRYSFGYSMVTKSRKVTHDYLNQAMEFSWPGRDYALKGEEQKGIPVRKVLVQWSERPPEEATWKWLSEFKKPIRLITLRTR